MSRINFSDQDQLKEFRNAVALKIAKKTPTFSEIVQMFPVHFP